MADCQLQYKHPLFFTRTMIGRQMGGGGAQKQCPFFNIERSNDEVSFVFTDVNHRARMSLSLWLGTEQVVSSIPGSVGYISHVH